MPSVFDLDYVPQELLVRSGIAQKLLVGTYPKIIYGDKDTGKTLTAKWLATVYKPDLVVHVICSTSMRYTLERFVGLKPHLLISLREFFASVGDRIVIFDDVQNLAKNRKKELNNVLKEFVDRFPERKVILITNWGRLEFWSVLEPDVADRYSGCEKVPFGNYSPEEAKAIFEQRFEIAGIKVDDGISSYLAGRYAQGALFRDIFRILDQMIRTKKVVALKEVEAVFDSRVAIDFLQDFESLAVDKAIAFGAVALAQANAAKNTTFFGASPMSQAQDAYREFSRIREKLGASGASYRTFLRLVDALKEEGYVTAEEGPQRGRPLYISCSGSFHGVVEGFRRWMDGKYGKGTV